MNINIKTRVAIKTAHDGSLTKVIESECGGVSVDNEGDLVVIDDKEGVILVLESSDWESFKFTNEAEKPSKTELVCSHGFPPESCPKRTTALCGTTRVGGEISSCTTYPVSGDSI